MRPEQQEQCENEVEATREVKQLKSKFLDEFFAGKEQQLFQLLKGVHIAQGHWIQKI